MFREIARDAGARTGTVAFRGAVVTTPAFMPVGTRGAVKGLDARDLLAVGAEMVLSNTYHLMLRPGAATVAAMGGLAAFQGWPGPTLTDSGGYQIFSLDPRVTETDAVFRSTYDGSEVRLSPEEAVRCQQLLGADVAMVLDVLIGLPAPNEAVRAAMEQTLRWSSRARDVHDRTDQALFGIVQGGVDPTLRGRSARATTALDFDGYGIGGLSVGESPDERDRAIEAAVAELPADKLRYVMGLGDAEGVLDAVARGCDLFDCVWPTRLARHGRVLTPDGDYNLKRAEYAADPRPLHEECSCLACGSVSRAYLRHLLMTKEMTVMRLLSMHNLTYTLGLMAETRGAIERGRFSDHRVSVVERRNGVRREDR
ncbi:MAG TPA: tRNA guanosine(34) transglycosylase Tgt [Acidimicrobiia bacterium]|nr:tRNA guanosine(34) transglycosylase Tgt [Acidimicrobiia bacterium]